MYDHNTGTFFDGNVPFEERDTYQKQIGYGKPRQLANWEKVLVDDDIIKAKIKYYKQLHGKE